MTFRHPAPDPREPEAKFAFMSAHNTQIERLIAKRNRARIEKLAKSASRRLAAARERRP